MRDVRICLVRHEEQLLLLAASGVQIARQLLVCDRLSAAPVHTGANTTLHDPPRAVREEYMKLRAVLTGRVASLECRSPALSPSN
eukprot:6191584-Pleurochrysis_carterae.AAC.2